MRRPLAASRPGGAHLCGWTPPGSVPRSMSKLLGLGLVAALLCASSCEKGGDTKAPGDGGAGAADPASGEVVLRYKVGAGKLSQAGKFDLNTSGGGQFGVATIEYTAILELEPQGDKLKVAWSLADIGKGKGGYWEDSAGYQWYAGI